jgi:hypothetical protein
MLPVAPLTEVSQPAGHEAYELKKGMGCLCQLIRRIELLAAKRC